MMLSALLKKTEVRPEVSEETTEITQDAIKKKAVMENKTTMMSPPLKSLAVEANSHVSETVQNEIIRPVKVPESQPTEVSQAQLLNIDISEEQVVTMEQNLNELQKDVSLFRDEKGWVVRFHSRDNLLSQMGFHDNDLIRFGHFEKLKEDPSRSELITRLESVMMNLQR